MPAVLRLVAGHRQRLGRFNGLERKCDFSQAEATRASPLKRAVGNRVPLHQPSRAGLGALRESCLKAARRNRHFPSLQVAEIWIRTSCCTENLKAEERSWILLGHSPTAERIVLHGLVPALEPIDQPLDD